MRSIGNKVSDILISYKCTLRRDEALGVLEELPLGNVEVGHCGGKDHGIPGGGEVDNVAGGGMALSAVAEEAVGGDGGIHHDEEGNSNFAVHDKHHEEEAVDHGSLVVVMHAVEGGYDGILAYEGEHGADRMEAAKTLWHYHGCNFPYPDFQFF
mmetsp:Transcript_14624/g.20677  ORF Transcript_14624/g.20677 Transcript_14624/m.20677 type:complete len:154 (+) Transcript_14624:1674-2135(+)